MDQLPPQPERPAAAPPAPHPGYYPPPQVLNVQQPANGAAVAALVCGIVGIVLGLIPILFFVAWALGITSFVLGIIGRGTARRLGGYRQGSATAGIVLGVVAFAVGCFGYAVVNDAFGTEECVTPEFGLPANCDSPNAVPAP